MKNIFKRSPLNPIIAPNPNHDWESFKIYNPGAYYEGGVYHLFYRAMNRGENWHSSIGYAFSSDGERFNRLETPILYPEKDDEKRGVEDPRVTKVGETYFMAYAAYDGDDVRLNIAISRDLKKWVKRGRAFSDFRFLERGGSRLHALSGRVVDKNKRAEGKELSKSGAIFSEKINGKFWMLFGEHNVWLANSDDGLHWNVMPGVFLSPRAEGYFDSVLVEMGPPPIKTEKGWLVLYHGVDKWGTYRLGFLLLDLDEPERIVYRHNEPIFEPQEKYEMQGFVDVLPGGISKMQQMNDAELAKFIEDSTKNKQMNAVIFCCGAVVVGDLLQIYYGAGDSYVCTATASLAEVLNLIS